MNIAGVALFAAQMLLPVADAKAECYDGAKVRVENGAGDKIPLFECPDEDIERTYYFRWWTYRKHFRKTSVGWVVTEFLPDRGRKVPWIDENLDLRGRMARQEDSQVTHEMI